MRYHVVTEPDEVATICKHGLDYCLHIPGNSGVMANWYKHPKYVPVLAYAKEDAIVGVALVLDYHCHTYISVYVLGDYRKKGVATQLLQSLLPNISSQTILNAYGMVYRTLRKLDAQRTVQESNIGITVLEAAQW